MRLDKHSSFYTNASTWDTLILLHPIFTHTYTPRRSWLSISHFILIATLWGRWDSKSVGISRWVSHNLAWLSKNYNIICLTVHSAQSGKYFPKTFRRTGLHLFKCSQKSKTVLVAKSFDSQKCSVKLKSGHILRKSSWAIWRIQRNKTRQIFSAKAF